MHPDRSAIIQPMTKQSHSLLGLGLLFLSQVLLADITTVNTLIQQGAWDSAQKMLDAEQPSNSDAKWMEWEIARLNLISASPNWPDSAYSHLLAASKHSNKNLARQALALLFKEAKNKQNSADIQKWGWAWLNLGATDTEQRLIRRAMIDSYLWQGKTEEATTALTRYNQDFGALNGEDLALLTQNFIQANSAETARSWVNALPTGHPIQLCLIWRLKLLTPDRLIPIIQQTQIRTPDIRYWQLIGALSPNNSQQQLQAYEILAGKNIKPLADIPPINGATLWQAYEAYGYQYAMQANLIQGEDEAWLKLASSASNPLDARALWTWLSQHAQDANTKQQAAVFLHKSLTSTPDGRAAWLALALEPQAQEMNTLLRYQSALLATETGNKKAESELWLTLNNRPDTIPYNTWHLQKAAALIHTNQNSTLTSLNALSTSTEALNAEQTDVVLSLLLQLPKNTDTLLSALKPKLTLNRINSLKLLGELYLSLGKLPELTGTWLNLATLDPSPSNRLLALNALRASGRFTDAENLQNAWSKTSARKKP